MNNIKNKELLTNQDQRGQFYSSGEFVTSSMEVLFLIA